MTYTEIIAALQSLSNEEKLRYKQEKFGIIAKNSLGIYQSDLNDLIKKIKMDDVLAVNLFNSGIYEARIICAKIFNPKNLTNELMEEWVVTFDNWEICDTFAMKLFSRSNLAIPKALEWTKRTNEFEKRAGFAVIASYCMAEKKASNQTYESFLPIILSASDDERLYVKKAVNWALRSIGKRNIDLKKLAIDAALEMSAYKSKAAQWIAKDALKELQGENVKILDYPRAIYRKKTK